MLENTKQKEKLSDLFWKKKKKVGRYTQHFVKLDGNQRYELLKKMRSRKY